MADELSEQVGDQLAAINVHRASDRRDVSMVQLPQTVQSIDSRGKKLLIRLETQTLVYAPLMTGRIMYRPTDKGTTLIMTFVFASGVKWYVEDARTFSQLTVVPKSETQAWLDRYVGKDWLSTRPVSLDEFSAVCRRKKTAIGVLLVDQKQWAGLGNYLRAEVLYRAKIDPHRSAQTLSADERSRLYATILDVTHQAYRARGLTIAQYRTPTGQTGVFQPSVYGRREDPDGHQVVSSKLGGQSIYWVPDVQQ